MKYIKKFKLLNDADGFAIINIPFVCRAGNELAMCNQEGKKLVVNGNAIEVVAKSNTRYMLIYEENIFSSINDVFDGFDELVEPLDTEALRKFIGENYNQVFNTGPDIQWDPFLYSSFFEYCQTNMENVALDDADADVDTVIPCLITLSGVDRIVFLYPHICFEATSDSSADTCIYGVYFDDPNNKNSVHYISIAGSVSIETDGETGDSRVVVGQAHNIYEISGPFDTNAINKLYNTYISDELFQPLLKDGVESGQLTVYSEYNNFASILVNKEVE